jgi:hypothetical protein
MRCKYIKTFENKIIIFSELQQHSEFMKFQPVSAGFISFGVSANSNPDCACFGESVSLKLKSHDVDTTLVKRQIFGLFD